MDTYHYTAISEDGEGETIRLIDIHPGSDIDILQCTMRHVRLADSPQYEALSYCWGDPTPNQTIKCNGKPLAITTSLQLALRRLRFYPPRIRALWADAICINQKDIDERNQQVRLMRRVYEQAQSVVVWLGEAANDSSLGMKLVSRLVEANSKRDSAGVIREITEPHSSSDLQNLYGLPSRIADDWPGFFGILKRPWFGRGWIIQEAALASSITIYCGESTCSYDDFMLALIVSSNIGLAMEYMTSDDARVWTMGLTRQASQSGVKQNLLSLLLRHRTASTTDPRDKVYALCGLATDAGSEGLDIRPDYRLPVLEVYRDIAVKMLTKGRTLDVLSVPRDHESSEFPSWVPDLSKPLPTSSLTGLEHNIVGAPMYRVSLDTECHPRFSIDGCLLGLSGLLFDVVSEVGETQPLEEGDNDKSTIISRMFDAFAERKRYMNWRALTGLLYSRKYVTGEDLEDAYWQTLIAGYNPGVSRLRDKDRIKAHYLAWTRHSLRHAYLRRLPSPAFEFALTLILVLSLGWILFRFLICLPKPAAPHEFKEMMGNAANRRLFRTEHHYIGLAGDAVQAGDLVVICRGGKLPLIARKDKPESIKLVGDCYVHGIMQGEAFDGDKCELMWFA
ncbi:hypothetical protein N7G274_002138 [Stereocaulon virgatum]|uniref:Heterokaryon incompatibility domain-containing protein n=1 Tax=Stereocaulon virgatum TaxID=373712 RepID=A0ABR4ALY3_9LECA